MDEKDKLRMNEAGEPVDEQGETTDATASEQDKEAAAAAEQVWPADEHDNERDALLDDAVSENAGPAEPSAEAVAPRKSGGKGWMAVSAVLAVVLVVVLIKPPFAASPTVASVNGEAITQDALYDRMVGSGGKPMLSQLIDEALVNQEMKKQGAKVADADIDKRFNEIKSQFPTEADFNSALEQSQMTEADLRGSIKTELQLTALMKDKVSVSDADVKTYYDQNKDSFNTPAEVTASHIVVKTQDEADAIKKQVEGGADFAAIAKDKSLDDQTKAAGGSLGVIQAGQAAGVYGQEFEDVAFKLNKGQVGIAKSDQGYHVIQVSDKKEAHTATFEEKKDLIRSQMVSGKVYEQKDAYMQELRSKAKITNSLDKTGSETETSASVSDNTAAPAAQ